MIKARSPEKLPGGKQVIYAAGQFGWSLGSYAVSNLINYFYMSPEGNDGAVFPVLIFQGAVLGIATVIGLLNAFGRVFDAVTDPLVAGLSDRSTSRFGKRRVFMAIGGLPFAVFSVLVFTPIVGTESTVNAVWLAISLSVFYLGMTVYVVPFTAMISEIGHTRKERLHLSALVSVAWALGFAVGNQVYAVQAALTPSFGATGAFQLTIALFAIASLVAMYLPVFFVDERRYSEYHVSKEAPFKAVATAFQSRNFVMFSLSDLMYWMALTFTQTGISFYVTLLLGLPAGYASLLMTILFVLSIIFYVPISRLAHRTGKKRLMLIAFGMLGLTFAVFFALGSLNAPAAVQGVVIVAVAAFPIAALGILPTAILSDIAASEGIKKGTYKAGVFFGARNFVRKMGVSLANLLFPSFLLLGRSLDNPLGVRISAVAAAAFCLLGFLFFMRYREDEIEAVLRAHEESPPATD